jgi:hypothetical protein
MVGGMARAQSETPISKVVLNLLAVNITFGTPRSMGRGNHRPEVVGRSAGERMMNWCHLIFLLLIGVDWVEDPYFGQSAFSRTMSSTPCCKAQSQLETHDVQVKCLIPPAALCPRVADWVCLLTFLVTPVTFESACIPSLHMFMSLQR